MAVITQIQLRHDTAANWTAANTVLALGELGYESNTGLFKLGDGATGWTALGYAAINTASGDTRYLLATTKGAASGIASLDSTGKLVSSQLPSLRVGKVNTVATQAAMLALAADDDLQFAIRSDTNATFILPANADPTVLANWLQLPAPTLTGVEMVANKGAASGYAGLDSNGHVPAAQLGTINGGTA